MIKQILDRLTTRYKAILAALLLAALTVAATQSATNFSTLSKLCPGCSISRGDQGMGSFIQFGANDDIDDSEETLHLAGLFGGPDRVIIDLTPITLFISSDSVLDTQSVLIQGIDANHREVFVFEDLNGLTFTQIGLPLNWLAINRVSNRGTADLTGNIFVHTDPTDGNADGIPDDPATQLRRVVLAAEGISSQAVYTVPDEFQAFLTQICYSAFVTMGNEGFAKLSIVTHTAQVEDREISASIVVATPNGDCRDFFPPVIYQPRTTIEITALSNSASSNMVVSAAFNIVLTRAKLET